MTEEEVRELLKGEFDLDIPNFKKWNPDTRHRRYWFALSIDWMHDPKIMKLTHFQKSVWLHLLSFRAASAGTLTAIGMYWVSSRLVFRGGPALHSCMVKLWKLQLIDLRRVSLQDKTREDEQDKTEVFGRLSKRVALPKAPKPSSPPSPLFCFEDLCATWNGAGLKPCLIASEYLRERWRERWLEKPEEDYWRGLISKVTANAFCSGKGKGTKKWVATLGWFLQKENHEKLTNGEFDPWGEGNGKSEEEVIYNFEEEGE